VNQKETLQKLPNNHSIKNKKKKLKELLKQGGNKMETEIEVNDANFDEKVIEASKNKPIVVDFWAGWCGPCKMLGPILEKLAKEYNGKFILAKVDVNENKEKASQYEVRSIPNVKLFKDGVIIDELIGYLSEEKVKEWLDKNLG